MATFSSARRLPEVLVLVAVVFAAACSRDQSATPTATTTAPPTTAPACPVDAEICQFAREAETRLRAHDVAWLLDGADVPVQAADLMMNLLLVTGEPIRLATIGCPIADGSPSCKGRFALVMVALPQGDYRDPRGLEVLVFRRTAESRPLHELTLDAAGPDRITAAEGGDGRACDFAGLGNPPGTECMQMHFYPLGPTAIATPATATPETIAGVTVHPLTVGAPAQIPANLSVYYFPGGYGKDAYLPDLRRVHRDTGGALQDERLFASLGTVYTMALNLDAGLIGVGVCDNQARGVTCGTPSYPATGDSTATAYISADSGATFTALGALPRNAWVHAAVDGQLLIGIYEDPATTAAVRFEYFPSGVAVPAPVAASTPLLIPGVGLAWTTDDGALYRPGGSLLRKAQTLGQRGGLALQLTPSRWLDEWWQPGAGGPGAQTSTVYLGTFDAAGTLQRAFSWKADIRPIAAISDHELIGNYAPTDAPGLNFPAMILDLDTGIIHPIDELTAALRAAGSKMDPFIVAVKARP